MPCGGGGWEGGGAAQACRAHAWVLAGPRNAPPAAQPGSVRAPPRSCCRQTIFPRAHTAHLLYESKLLRVHGVVEQLDIPAAHRRHNRLVLLQARVRGDQRRRGQPPQQQLDLRVPGGAGGGRCLGERRRRCITPHTQHFPLDRAQQPHPHGTHTHTAPAPSPLTGTRYLSMSALLRCAPRWQCCSAYSRLSCAACCSRRQAARCKQQTRQQEARTLTFRGTGAAPPSLSALRTPNPSIHPTDTGNRPRDAHSSRQTPPACRRRSGR